MHRKETHTVQYPPELFRPTDWLRFIHLPPFDNKWARFKLTDRDLNALQIAIMAGPERFPVIQGTRGLRKLRFAGDDSNLSKRESFRVCFSHFPEYGIAVLVTIFAKNETADLNAADKRAISAILSSIEHELDKGIIQ
jgi:hypothetical protein